MYHKGGVEGKDDNDGDDEDGNGAPVAAGGNKVRERIFWKTIALRVSVHHPEIIKISLFISYRVTRARGCAA